MTREEFNYAGPMTTVRLAGIGTAYPENWITQDDAVRWIGDATGDHRRVAAIARGSQIGRRAICLPASDFARLGSIEERNAAYHQLAPPLAINATRSALGQHHGSADVGLLVAVSCTGYMVPGWDVRIVQELDLSLNTVRLPITQAGCAGGVLAIGRAADYLRANPDSDALAVSTELCSLAFHPDLEPGNLTSSLIFGDGAGAALLKSGDESDVGGLEIVDSLSTLLPASEGVLGFELTNEGFRSILSREVAEVLALPTIRAVKQLLLKHELIPEDIAFWLVHAGGPKIISGVEQCFDLAAHSLKWSWQTLEATGNTSSVSIFDVLQRYIEDEDAPRGWGVVMAFGPGVSIELLLVRRCD